MKKQSKVIVGFILVTIVVVFSAINTRKVAVNFAFTVIQSPLIFIILGSAFLGALIVLVTWFSSFWSQRKELKALQEEVQQQEKKLAEASQSAKEKERAKWENQLEKGTLVQLTVEENEKQLAKSDTLDATNEEKMTE